MKTALLMFGLILSASAYAAGPGVDAAEAGIKAGSDVLKGGSAVTGVAAGATTAATTAQAIAGVYASTRPSAAVTTDFVNNLNQIGGIQAPDLDILRRARVDTVINDGCIARDSDLEGPELTNLAHVVEQVTNEVDASGHTVDGLDQIARNKPTYGDAAVQADAELNNLAKDLKAGFIKVFPGKAGEAGQKLVELEKCGVGAPLAERANQL